MNECRLLDLELRVYQFKVCCRDEARCRINRRESAKEKGKPEKADRKGAQMGTQRGAQLTRSKQD
ncbi:hypothetical protein E2C01_085821 [Portunus trituberculatus]|uniref:Uncharacterized protein n=1 Tax=Portunus trituberculatus TaxID=210409 RepID=A0A5B7J7Q5_PORTR|nr:hypothetical protein [Portunus trituberculatus]